jgi:hypothetical protein
MEIVTEAETEIKQNSIIPSSSLVLIFREKQTLIDSSADVACDRENSTQGRIRSDSWLIKRRSIKTEPNRDFAGDSRLIKDPNPM